MLQQGTYTLSVTDTLGCVNYTTATIKIDLLPTGVLTSNNANNNCVPFCAQYQLKSTSTSSIINTKWTANSSNFSGETFSLCVAKASENVVVGTFTDMIGCINTVSFAIKAYASPVADFVFSPEKPIENGDLVFFDDNTKGDKLVKWNWYFGNGSALGTGQRTSYVFENAGTYPMVMVVSNSFGCADTAIKTIVVNSEFKLFVPNSFTPNGDGVNDTFQPKGRGIAKYTLTIYDRWGKQVFRTNNFETGWNGEVYGTNSSDDIFAWRINAVDDAGKVKELTGHVTLSR